MDNDSPTARVERTLWTVWCYITGAFSRFFRPEPTNIVTNDPNSIQESAVESEPPNSGHPEGDASRREVDEEQHLATASVLSSSRPVIAWELCTTDIDLGPDEESTTQLSRGSESEESDQCEGTREEQLIQTGNNEVGLLIAKKDDGEECGVHRQDEALVKDEYEEIADVAICEDTEESGQKAGAEEQTERVVIPDDQKIDETTTEIQVMEEDNQMHNDDEQELKAEEVKLCTTSALSLEEEDTMHIEEARVQEDKADTAVMHEEVKDSDGVLLLLASENENKPDDGVRQVESQLLVHEELLDDDRNFKGDPSFASLHVELQTALDKSASVSEDELIVVGQEHVMANRSENEKEEDAKDREDESEEENVNEAASNQTIDEVPEQDIKSVTEDGQKEDMSTRHVMCSEEVMQNAKTAEFTNGEQEDVTKEAKTRESDDDETGGEDSSERAVTPDDQTMDETMTKIQVQEDDKVHYEDEQELKAEEVKLCMTSALSLEEEDTMHIEEARVQGDKADTAVMHEEVKDSDGVLLLLASENEKKSDDGARQVESQLSVCEELSDDRNFKGDPSFASLHVELQTALDKSAMVSEDELIVGQEHVMANRSENEKDEDAKDREDESEEENVNEAASNQTADEVPEQDIKSVTEEGQEEDMSSRHVMCSEEVMQNAKTAELTDGEQEDVTKEAKIRESDDAETGGEDNSERAVTPDDQKISETMTKIQVQEGEEMHHEDEQELKAEEVKLCTTSALSLEEEDTMHIEEARVQRNEADRVVTHEEIRDSDGVLLLLASENEKKSDDGARQVKSQLSFHEELSDDDKGDPSFASLHVELQTALDKSASVSEDELIVGQEHVMANRSENEKDEDAKEREDESEEENVNEAASNQTMDEVPGQDIKDHEEEDISTGCSMCSEEVIQNAKTELHLAEFTDGEQEHVAKETKIRESDDVETESHEKQKSAMTTTDIPIVERFFDKDHLEERLDREISLEVECTTTSVTVKSEGETGQEISREFKNTSQGICEGRIVVLQELNSPTCEETQEGVPEYNNEPAGPDENTTQRFLEVGDCEEIQQLPEEVESKESKSLQNSGCSTGAEHMEEDQQSTEDTKKGFDLVVEEPQETDKSQVEPVIQDSRLLFEEEEGKLLVNLMKTGIGHSEKEFESDTGSPKELQDGTKELLVEFELDERLSSTGETLKFLETEVQKMIEPVDATNLEQNSYRMSSLLEDITESGFLKQSVEPKLFEDSPVEMLNAGIDMEETGYGIEEEAAEDEVQKNEMEILNLEVVGENSLLAESELLETKDQLSDEVLEISNDGSKTSESKPKDLIVITAGEMAKNVPESEGSYAEQTVDVINRRQDVIDEEILDLWIQTALSEDTEGTKQQVESQPGQQMDMEIEPSNEEQDEISSVHTEKGKEQHMESELVSDTEMSSSTAESGFSDQSLCEYGTQNSETQQLTSTIAGSFQGTYDLLANMSESADISELSTQKPNSQSQDSMMEETLQTRQLKEEESGLHADSGVTSSEARHLDQESDKSQEKTDEATGLQKEIDADITDQARKTDWNDTEVEKTNNEDEPLKITVSDSPDEIEHADSGRSRSGSEASLEEGNVSTESGSQDDTCPESEKKLLKFPSLDKPQPEWSEDITDLLPGLKSTEVPQPTPESEDLLEVDASMLDFTAQRSRIAVKNRRVRPPKDPRSLLHMPSVEPTPPPRPPVKVPVGVPLGGLGIGIKLPGLGAGFPVLKKTQGVVRDENSPDTLSQVPETKPVEKSDTPKQDVTPNKPKWMPPGHAGFGNPLMAELKNKLKKTTKE